MNQPLVLLDTNTVSNLLHQRPGFESIVAALDGREFGTVLISSITLSELYTMADKAANPQNKHRALAAVLLRFPVPAFDEAAARHVGSIRAYLEPLGKRIGPMDTLIAAHARSLDAVVVTDNVAEFSRVPGLRVENWFVRSPA
ncbi:MAG: type II toxin-antitoxin system VapC family toxin [Sulfuritalea sp.]|nr:type II toxin-antitoxin system VapC family toxin [Sulfuritalea sp.]